MPVPPAGPYGPTGAYPGAGSAAAKGGPTPAGVLNALKRRWVLATFIGGLAAVATAVAVWAALPAGKHTAKASVQIRAMTVQVGTTPGGGSADDFETFRRSQVFLLKTRDLVTRTLAEPSIASLETIKAAGDDAVKLIEDGVKIDGNASPDILTVSMSGDNPEDMKAIIDMLIKKYVDDATAYERKGRDEKLRKLEGLAENFKAEIQSREKQITLMVEANGTAGGPAAETQAAARQQELARLTAEGYQSTKEVHELEVNVGLLEKKLDAIKADPKRLEVDPILQSQLVDQDLRVSPLIGKRVGKELLLQREISVGGDPNAPTILALKGEIEKLDKEITGLRVVIEPEVRGGMQQVSEQQLRNRLADLRDKLTGTRSLLGFRLEYRDKFAALLLSGAKGGFAADSLRKELEPQREYLNKIETQRVQLLVDKQLDARVQIREAAYVILNQNVKQKAMISAAGAMAAFVGVVGLIGLLEWRTRRIDGVEQVVGELGMRVIGTVPAFPNKASLKAAEAAGNANWRFVLNESINSTRTMLLHAARAQSMQVVMVTSATQGEGKTSLASQLGSSMATAGMRTLIVDCDLRNPSIHKLFELGLTAGVSEVLLQEADVADAVQPTSVPNLWIIPAGQCSNRVISALAQGHPLETLFNRLRGQFDFIVVDSCPVLPVADALLIGQHVDGVVFSIMQDISQLPKVLVASEKLQQLNVPLLGAVVNGVNTGSAYYAYGYNYVKQLPA